MRFTMILALAITTGAASGFVAPPPAEVLSGEDAFTEDFDLQTCRVFLPHARNPYFSLHPGRFLRFEGDDDGEFVELEITVLPQTRVIPFEMDGASLLAIARVVEEREWADGELVEVSRNYFARCPRSNDIFYFGEEVDIYEDGEIVSHDGAWLAGEDGALPGLIMPGRFLLGARYYQEIAPDVALDRAEHAVMGEEVTVPAGTFADCVTVVETTPLDPDEESIKVYARGVGLIIDDALELVAYH